MAGTPTLRWVVKRARQYRAMVAGNQVEDFLIQKKGYQALERRRKYYLTPEEVGNYIAEDAFVGKSL